MKKMILLPLLALSMTACSSNSSNPSPAPQQPNQAPQSMKMGGTVAMLMHLILPQAQAMGQMIPSRFNEPLAGLPDTEGLTCPADRCAFLVDSGERDASGKLESSATIIAVTPVVDGKFMFELSAESAPAKTKVESVASGNYEGKIYRVVIRNWDAELNELRMISPDDRELTISSQDIMTKDVTKLEVTPETTLSSRTRVEALKSNREASEDRSVLDLVMSLFKKEMESVREASLRLLAGLATQENSVQYLRALVSGWQKPSIDLSLLQAQKVEAKFSGMNDESAFNLIQEEGVRVHILSDMRDSLITVKEIIASYRSSQGMEERLERLSQISNNLSDYKNEDESIRNDDESTEEQLALRKSAHAEVKASLVASGTLARDQDCEKYYQYSNMKSSRFNVQNLSFQIGSTTSESQELKTEITAGFDEDMYELFAPERACRVIDAKDVEASIDAYVVEVEG